MFKKSILISCIYLSQCVAFHAFKIILYKYLTNARLKFTFIFVMQLILCYKYKINKFVFSKIFQYLQKKTNLTLSLFEQLFDLCLDLRLFFNILLVN